MIPCFYISCGHLLFYSSEYEGMKFTMFSDDNNARKGHGFSLCWSPLTPPHPMLTLSPDPGHVLKAETSIYVLRVAVKEMVMTATSAQTNSLTSLPPCRSVHFTESKDKQTV